MRNAMPIDPKDASDIMLWINAIKSQWQTIVGGISAGAYAVWKYLNRRIQKLEDVIVTSKMLTAHTESEDAKFEALFRYHENQHVLMTEQVRQMTEMGGTLKGIGDSLRFVRERQLVNEERITALEQSVAVLIERDRWREGHGE